MAKYHINGTGEAKPCTATKRACRFGGTESHYGTHEEAQQEAERRLSEDYDVNVSKAGTTDVDTEADTDDVDDNNEVRYSFIAEYEKTLDDLEADFEGVPSRFANADIPGNKLSQRMERFEARKAAIEAIEALGKDVGPYERSMVEPSKNFRVDEIHKRMYQAASAPDDAATPEDKLVEVAQSLGFDEFKKMQNTKVIGSIAGGQDVYIGKINGTTVIIPRNSSSKDLGAKYHLRSKMNEEIGSRSFNFVDVRSMVGAYRVDKMTRASGLTMADGVSPMHGLLADSNKYPTVIDGVYSKENSEKNVEFNNQRVTDSLAMMESMQEAQRRLKGIQQQRKYIKDSGSTVASAWEDKKNPDKTRQKMMKETVLNKYFSKVEIDNDVNPEEYAQFENDYLETMDKLPKIPGQKTPILRIRRLGKHKAKGVFFPHVNTVCVDIRDSSAFVHEMGHQMDIAVKNNASLSKDFDSITKGYSKNLKIPAGEPKSREAYLTTPTEISSRFFEVYAHERLGIKNKLLNPENLNSYDYDPIRNNPDLKEKAFKFFDKVYYGKE